MRALKIAVDGRVRPIDLDAPDTPGFLAQAQAAVGGPVELVALAHTVCLLVDEEGRIHGATPNHIATRLAQAYGRPGTTLVGDAIVAGLVRGELTDLPRGVDEYLQLIAPTV